MERKCSSPRRLGTSHQDSSPDPLALAIPYATAALSATCTPSQIAFDDIGNKAEGRTCDNARRIDAVRRGTFRRPYLHRSLVSNGVSGHIRVAYAASTAPSSLASSVWRELLERGAGRAQQGDSRPLPPLHRRRHPQLRGVQHTRSLVIRCRHTNCYHTCNRTRIHMSTYLAC